MIALLNRQRLLAFEVRDDLSFLLKAMEDCDSFVELRQKYPKAFKIYMAKYRLPRRIGNQIINVYYQIHDKTQHNWDQLVIAYYKETRIFLKMRQARND